ncbi:MAG TPA: deoxyribonuclease IV [Bryobacteraceae bacterium]|nr:deoxyribonuclease IV [Bryobacteraceae bacterium]
MVRLRIGIHTSIAGSLDQAAVRAAELDANTFQIFSSSPRMWRARTPSSDEIRNLRETCERHDLTPLVIHDNYLINLAAADPKIRAQSIAAFRGEIERALALGAEHLVAHPGSYKNQTLEQGMRTLVESLVKAAKGLRGPLTLLLENTAGSGSAIGSRFEELAELRRLASDRVGFEIGFCLDTAHCLASGYNVATRAGLEETVREADRILGLAKVHVIHANDSKTPLGSRVDRHEHIGEGYIGIPGFRRILNHPRLRSKAFILETPIDRDGDDRRNLETLKNLCRKSRTTTTRSS